MTWEIQITAAARRSLARLEVSMQRRLAVAIDRLASDPRPPGCKRLTNQRCYRIRVGDYRVVYDVEDAVLRVLVLKLGHRRDIYDRS